ncbi:MAG: hypothetical protein M1390_01845 [Candidatus Marsarchaeota archaeon]|jgi:hypothetical protein|nr:hypothetical protein [Candidatus Marsarchaeota archaeon]
MAVQDLLEELVLREEVELLPMLEESAVAEAILGVQADSQQEGMALA